jgi:hypothetical protein
VKQFKYLVTNLTNQNSVYKKIKSRLKSGNTLFSAELFSSSLLSKNTKLKIYTIITLPVALCGYETWSLTLIQEHQQRMSENTVLRKIFGPKRNHIPWEWCRLHNKELYDLYFSPNIIQGIKSRRMTCAMYGKQDRCTGGFGGEAEFSMGR